MRYTIAFVLLIAFAVSPVSGQTGTFLVTGRVVELGSERAVSGATVLLGDAWQVVTDERGEFTFREVRPGQYPLVIDALGYETARTTILVQGDEAGVIRLRPRPLPLPSISARSQTFTLHGRVVERASGRDVPFVEVRISADDRTSTNEGGRFRMSKLFPGTYVLTVEGFGWLPVQSHIDLDRDTSVVLAVDPDPITQRIIAQQVEKLASRIRSVGRGLRVLDREEFLRSNAATAVDILKGRGGVQLNRCPRSTVFACIGNATPVVYIDERRVYCGIEVLAAYPVRGIQRIEVIGRGSMIRVYTVWFIERMNSHRIPIDPVTFTDRTFGEC